MSVCMYMSFLQCLDKIDDLTEKIRMKVWNPKASLRADAEDVNRQSMEIDTVPVDTEQPYNYEDALKFSNYHFDIIYAKYSERLDPYDESYAQPKDIEAIMAGPYQGIVHIWPEGKRDAALGAQILSVYDLEIQRLYIEIAELSRQLTQYYKPPTKPYKPRQKSNFKDDLTVVDCSNIVRLDRELGEKQRIQADIGMHKRQFIDFGNTTIRRLDSNEILHMKKALVILFFVLEANKTGDDNQLLTDHPNCSLR